MMMIDAFCHILPPKYLKARDEKTIKGWTAEKGAAYVNAVSALYELDARFRIMDKFPGLLQILTIADPPIESLASPEDAPDLAKKANDEMAELVMKYPDRFVAAIACLPMNNIPAALKEIDRAIKDLRFKGIQVDSQINGKPLDSPEFIPVWEKMAYYNLPVMIHPWQDATIPDYDGEKESKYLIWTNLGWPHATSKAMLRLSGSGILEKFPNIKFVTHHAGGTVPYLNTRISMGNDFNEMRMGYRYEAHLTKKMTDYLRMFYYDTAVYGNAPTLMCAYAFCGVDHMLFATDMPFDRQAGEAFIRETIRSLNEMNITEEERKKIYSDNAKKLFRLAI